MNTNQSKIYHKLKTTTTKKKDKIYNDNVKCRESTHSKRVPHRQLGWWAKGC